MLRFGDKQASRPHSVMFARDAPVRPAPLTDQTHKGMYIKINKKNRKIFITLISLRLQFGAVFKDWPIPVIPIDGRTTVVMRTSILFH